MKKEVEDTRIYQRYLEFISYIEMITEKYPNVTKYGIVSVVKRQLYEGIENILYAYKAFEKQEKLMYLNRLDINLKMLKVLARVSYKKKYITIKNYEAWSRKINAVGVSLGGWINSCVKH